LRFEDWPVTTLIEPFTLPADREADRPPEARGLARDQVRLLVVDGEQQTHATFGELPRFLKAGDLVVVNNSATMPAAVDADTAEGPAVLHFSTVLDDGRWVVELRTPHGRPWPHPVQQQTRIRISEKAAVTLHEPWLPPARRLWIATPDFDVADLPARRGRAIGYAYLHGRWSMDYYDTVAAAYRTALDTGYLWHEFGDSALLLRAVNPEGQPPRSGRARRASAGP
jgi:S-adenosylmethionine:tRNA ribosyltransferase-isomerase